MKGSYLKYSLPMILAMLIANAEELSFTKNLPVDIKTKLVNENPLSTYDNRITIGPGFVNTAGGISYARIKPDSTYVGITTFVTSWSIRVTAVGGYNFLLSPRDRLAPVAGLSFFNRYSRYGTHIFPIVGLEYEHEFNKTFSVGADFACVLFRQQSNFALGVPCIFRLGNHKEWEIRVTPCWRNHQNWPYALNQITLGGSLGYRF